MNGGELSEKVRALRPAIKLLCISGYSDHDLPSGARFLKKPFTPDELLREARAVFDEPQPVEPAAPRFR
jgi:hypothetical protein